MKSTRLLLAACMAMLGTITCTAITNVTGTITCNGTGVAGVSVSDGHKWATTDSHGNYALDSDKACGYVFYILPSGYEATTTNGFMPAFWAPLSSDKKLHEKHDFILNKADNDNYKLIVATDLHLAARNEDARQFENLFMTSVHRVVDNSREKVYSLFLGDVVWDEFWYCNKFMYREYLDLLARNNYPTTVYHVMGNHDNDAAVAAGTQCDFLSSGPFRNNMGPRYYSLNLGKLHIIVLDDIFYKNEPTSEKQNEGVVGDQGYDDMVTAEQMTWLKEDLARVEDKDAPVIVAVHSQTWRVATDGKFLATPYLKGSNVYELDNVFHGFKNVKFVSGHSHYNYHAHPAMFPNVHENNIAAVCGTWWYTGNYSPRHLCRDGSPAGYELYSITGTDMKWRYTAIDPVDSVGSAQMRVYDMNTVSEFYRNSPEIKKLAEYYPKQMMYDNVPANEIMINIFDYDTDWKIEVIEDGRPLEVSRTVAIDPLHVLCSSVGIIKKENRKPGICRAINTNHMFVAQAATATAPVTVRVTDPWGHTYTQTLQRPKAFTTTMR